MDDLISRKAAIEAVKIPNGGYSNPSERHGIIIARVEARRAIQDIPSVPAVPLDKLLKWLNRYDVPCEICEDYLGCTEDHPCGGGNDAWEIVLTKWMKEEGLWTE